MFDLATARWKKARASNGNGGNNCVEVATLEQGVAMRDSTDPNGPHLEFSHTAWRSFLTGIRDGDFNRP